MKQLTILLAAIISLSSCSENRETDIPTTNKPLNPTDTIPLIRRNFHRNFDNKTKTILYKKYSNISVDDKGNFIIDSNESFTYHKTDLLPNGNILRRAELFTTYEGDFSESKVVQYYYTNEHEFHITSSVLLTLADHEPDDPENSNFNITEGNAEYIDDNTLKMVTTYNSRILKIRPSIPNDTFYITCKYDPNTATQTTHSLTRNDTIKRNLIEIKTEKKVNDTTIIYNKHHYIQGLDTATMTYTLKQIAITKDARNNPTRRLEITIDEEGNRHTTLLDISYTYYP